jgi:hypothetical protein
VRRWSGGNAVCNDARRSSRTQAVDRKSSHAPCLVRPRRGVFLTLFTAQVVWHSLSGAQRAQGVFGASIEISLPGTPAGLFLEGQQGGSRLISVILSEPPAVVSYALTDQGGLKEVSRATLRFHCRSWKIGAGPGGRELFGLTAEEDTLVVARRNLRGGFTETGIPLEVRPSRIVLADIDNDRRQEILLCGKSMAGVQVLRAARGGKYIPGPLLFPDISAVDLAVADLNGDGIADVFLANWISNEVAVFFGIARGVFSEQLTLGLNGEPAGIDLIPVNHRRDVQLVVALPHEKLIEVYTGNGAGEFRRATLLQTPIPPSEAKLTWLTGDLSPDLLVAGAQGMVTIAGRSSGRYDPPVVYGVGDIAGLWLVTDIRGDRNPELLCADRRGKRLLVASTAEPRSKFSWPPSYLVGDRPQGVVVTDANGDGSGDIVVANSGSASLSLLLNRGDGRLVGQAVLPTAPGPLSLMTVSGDPQTLIVTHRQGDRLSVVPLNDPEYRGGFSIPTASDPVVLSALRDENHQGLRILVHSLGGSQQSSIFSVFEQLTGSSFLERTFQASLPTAIRAFAACDFSGRGETDLLFLTHDRAMRNTTVSFAAAGDSFSYHQIQELLAVPDTANCIRSLFSVGDLRPPAREFLLLAGPPQDAVGVVRARGGGGFSEPYWIDHIRPVRGSTILLRDLDGDGRADLAVLNEISHSLEVYYGKESGQFSTARGIVASAGIRDFATGELRKKGRQDLVLTHEREGVVQVIFGPFLR